MSHAAFKQVFGRSGLTKAELAYIYGVSRQTIYDWFNETAEPKQGGITARFNIYTDALVKAIEGRALPLPTNLSKEVRRNRLLVIATQLHGLTKPTQPR